MSGLRRLLLISNSTLHGSGYLDHVEQEIRSFLGAARRVLFVPYAMHDLDRYAGLVRDRLQRMGFLMDSLHEPAASFDGAEAIFVGGGNTFRLVDALHRRELIEPIRKLVGQGRAYIGSSAGSIVAGPTLKTTKDMPTVQPPSFETLALVPFQISPHYLDPDPSSTHMGETQEQRIGHYHEDNDLPVVGLREGTLLRVEAGTLVLKGVTRARIFVKSSPAQEIEPGSRLDHLLA